MTTVEQKLDAIARMHLGATEEERRKAREELRKLLQKPPAVHDAESIVHAMLTELGAPCHVLGYPYAVEAILRVVADQSYINNITMGIYHQLAAQFDTTAARVERAMRHLIEVTWDRGDLDVLDKYFGNTVSREKGKPTNGEFIARMALLVRQQLKK